MPRCADRRRDAPTYALRLREQWPVKKIDDADEVERVVSKRKRVSFEIGEHNRNAHHANGSDRKIDGNHSPSALCEIACIAPGAAGEIERTAGRKHRGGFDN